MTNYQDWLDTKDAERIAVEKRRIIEDELLAYFSVRIDKEGTANFDDGDFKIKIVSRMNRRVNGDELQVIAREAGIDDQLSILFRWKPEIISATWKAADKSITDILSAAITVEPGRPSFTIERKEEK
jgi:hypothetical protein